MRAIAVLWGNARDVFVARASLHLCEPPTANPKAHNYIHITYTLILPGNCGGEEGKDEKKRNTLLTTHARALTHQALKRL